MASDEQVAAGSSQPGDNILCDIIAQQREFQLRQDSRNSTLRSSAALQKAPSTNLSEQRRRRESLAAASDEMADECDANWRPARARTRKFSLSQAMSNLASLTSGSAEKQPAGSKVSGANRRLQHRASLVPSHLADSEVRSAAEKKKGFMHKAIRRGSKMFDSMLLSSAQQQASKAQSDTSDSAEVPGGHRVQFATDDPADSAAADEETHPAGTRRRKLRLGSIPHDLRRALSLSNSAHQQQRASVGRSTLGNAAASPETAAATAAAAASSAASDEPRAPPKKPVKSTHHSAEQSGRLRRKNSLFAPLSSAGSAFYHAHLREQPAASAAASASQSSASFSLCQDHSRTYKLIIFGSSAVGKTSLIQRFLYGHFPVAHKPTVEELHSNQYNIPELGEIYLEILDTSGTFEFPAMRRLSIERGDAFILVYSVADATSWQEVIHLRQLILDEKREQIKPPAPAVAATSAAAVAKSQPVEQPLPVPEKVEVNRRSTAAQVASPTQVRRSSVNLKPAAAVATAAAQQESLEGAGSAPKPIAHYNNQLSRLLQQAPPSQTKGKLLQCSSIDEKDCTADDEDDNEDAETVAKPEAAKVTCKTEEKKPLQQQQQQQQHQQPEAQTKQQEKSRRTPIVVVANKCDLDTSSFQVDQDEAERLVREQWGNSFVKCSAKEALNIDRVFKELLRQARAPELLSQFVIDDHQQRRQSLPVLKNQISAHHVKGLRSLYHQQQVKQASQSAAAAAAAAASAAGNQSASSKQHQPQQQERSVSSASEDSQCRVM